MTDKLDGSPVGLNTRAPSTSEESDTIEEVYELLMPHLGLLERTPIGRIATCRVYEHISVIEEVFGR